MNTRTSTPTILSDESRDGRVAELLDQFVQSGKSANAEDVENFIAENPTFALPLRECLEGLAILQTAVKQVDSPQPRRVLHPGDQLGDYLIEDELGRGAMGVVYRATERSLNRTVALKVLSPISSLDQIRVQRFEREALAAASLDDPHIVPVYHVDQIDGLHFYVMRLVDGRSLEHADEVFGSANTPSPTRDREIAAAMGDVASALAATHDLGIVHRDIKPSNLLIDQAGKIWISDFGLARVASLGDLTASGDVVGTLRYMSPEQASGRADAVDRRSDIYSLGATLYEIVSAQRVFAGFDGLELLRRIQTSSPPPVNRVQPRVDRDLATIIARAMRPEKSDRYADASELAADLKRFAAGERVHASAVTLPESIRGWTRRHAAMMLVIISATTCLLMLSLLHNHILRSEQAKTSEALQSAAANYSQARAAVDQLGVEMADRLETVPGSDAVRREILERTLRYYEHFVDSSRNDAGLVVDVAMTRWQIARLVAKLDDPVKADQAYADAIMLLAKNDPTPDRTNYCQAINERAMLRSDAGDHQGALELLRMIDIDRAGDPAGRRFGLALTLNHLGIVYQRLHRHSDAISMTRRSASLLSDVSSGDLDRRRIGNLADSMNNLAAMMSDAGMADEAIALADRAIQLRKGLQSHDRDLSRLAIAHSNLATIQQRAGHHDKAIRSFRDAVRLLEKVVAASPTNTRSRGHLAVTLSNLGMTLSALCRTGDAETELRRAAAVLQPVVDANPTDGPSMRLYAGVLNNLAVTLRQRGSRKEASELIARAARMQRTASQWLTASDSDRELQSQIQSNLISLNGRP